jgi:hypothetical protein
MLQWATAAVRSEGKIERNGHFFALFLLWEFKAREAWPAIQEAFSLPDHGAQKLFGDADEYLPRMIATLAPNPTLAAGEIVENRNLEGFLRWNAARTYFQLFADGRISRDEAVQRLTEHLRTALDAGESDDSVVGLVYSLAELAAHEAMPDIERAFAANAIDECMIGMDDVRTDISRGNDHVQERLSRSQPAELKDTYDELKTWGTFQPGQNNQPQEWNDGDRASVVDEYLDEGAATEYEEAPATIRYDAAHVGRNDPCPCGSGRKFKKCCGSRATSQIDL